MTVINTNMAALKARNAAIRVTGMQEQAMERLSSGKRINAAADDAAGLSVASKMQSQLKGINMAVRNNHDGIGLIQTAEAGMETIRNMILRIRELAVQMANGIYEDTPDRGNADLEVTALLTQIDLIADNTKFNGIALLSGGYSQDIQAGATTAEKVRIGIGSITTSGLAMTGVIVGVTSITASLSTIELMDTALTTLNTRMSTLGSLQNRLTYSISNLSSASIMTEQALGRIMDADFAAETSNLAKSQILSQAATAMLAQANQSKQPLLQLLQG
ncbi:flagellin [Alphaproteobacteria bacterium]|nr:flagellin [Alphaproteobacteria bacterium]